MALPADAITAADLIRAFEDYAATGEQEHGIYSLFCALEAEAPQLLSRDQPWLQGLLGGPQGQRHPNPIPLPVPILPYDAGILPPLPLGCAALAVFHGALSRIRSYLPIVRHLGTIDSITANLQALRGLGLEADIHSDATPSHLAGLIDAGLPTLILWHDRGPLTSPASHDRWSLVHGYGAGLWHLYDGAEPADLLHGIRRPSTNQSDPHPSTAYPADQLEPRWLLRGHRGLMLTVRPPLPQ